MPLLNNSVWPLLSKIRDEEDAGDDPLYISVTGEQCPNDTLRIPQTKGRIRKTTVDLSRHAEKDLTYLEALESENAARQDLYDQLPSTIKRAFLEHIHHERREARELAASFLRRLREGAYFAGEQVRITISLSDATSVVLTGTIRSVNTTTNNDRQSPSNKENSQTCWQTYTVGMSDGTERSDVKHSQIERVNRLPSAEDLETFVRFSAFRQKAGGQLIWLVLPELCATFKIKDKLSPMFLGLRTFHPQSPGTGTTPNTPKRQKARKSLPPGSSSAKKSSAPSVDVTPAKPANTPKTGTPASRQRRDSSSDCDVIDLAASSEEDDHKPLKALRGALSRQQILQITSPSRRASSSSGGQQTPAVRRAASGPGQAASGPSKRHSTGTKQRMKPGPKPGMKKNASTPVTASKAGKQATVDKVAKKLLKPSAKQDRVDAMFRRQSSVRSDSTCGSSGPGTPSKAIRTPSKAEQARRKFYSLLDSVERINTASNHAVGVRWAKLVTMAYERNELPGVLLDEAEPNRPELIKRIRDKIERIKENKLLKTMTDEERAAYKAQKHKENAAKHRERAKEKEVQKKLANQKHEDQELSGSSPLPTPSLHIAPDDADDFARALGVVLFCQSFEHLPLNLADYGLDMAAIENCLLRSYLRPDESTAETEDGERVSVRLLSALLQVILHDNVAQDYRELGVKLSSVSVKPEQAVELARLVLRPTDDPTLPVDADGEEDEEAASSSSRAPTPDAFNKSLLPLLDRLRSAEWAELSLAERLCVLEATVNRLLSADAVNDYMNNVGNEGKHAHKSWLAAASARNEFEAKNKDRRRELEQELQDVERRRTELDADDARPQNPDMSPEKLGERVRRRREAAAQQRELAERRRTIDVELGRLQTLASRYAADADRASKRLAAAKQAQTHARAVPSVGCDRNHLRYWTVNTTCLLAEEGWNENVSDLTGDAPSTAVCDMAQMAGIEKTFPTACANSWSVYSGTDAIRRLHAALNTNGIRESRLSHQLAVVCPWLSKPAAAAGDKPNQPESAPSADTPSADGDEANMDKKATATDESKSDDTSPMDTAASVAPHVNSALELYRSTLHELYGRLHRAMFVDSSEEKSADRVEQILLASSMTQMRDLLLDVYDGINHNCIGGALKKKDNDSRVNGWRTAVATCSTFARLHFLTSILEDSVAWSKSAEDARCHVCKHKMADDDGATFIFCDAADCSRAYHLRCIRPRMTRVPDDDWLCAACKPSEPRSARLANGTGRYNEQSSDEESEEQSDSEEEEEEERQRTDRRQRAQRRARVVSSSDGGDDDSETEHDEPQPKVKRVRVMLNRETDIYSSEQDDFVEPAPSSAKRKEKPVAAATAAAATGGGKHTRKVIEAAYETLIGDRFVHSSLMQLPDQPSGTRSNRKAKVAGPTDFTEIGKKLSSYKTLDGLIQDANAVCDKASLIYHDQQRKLRNIDDVRTLIVSIDQDD